MDASNNDYAAAYNTWAIFAQCERNGSRPVFGQIAHKSGSGDL